MAEKNADEYFTVSSQPVSSEIKINDSKFIGHVFHVLTKHQAESVYANIKRKYHDATHNCFAYRITADQFRYSDDGEPSGTAGLPIYKILEKKDLSQTIIIITRYFGGTKLGAGGLIRAYIDAALDVLDKTKIEKKMRYITVTVETTYENMSLLLDFVNRSNGIIGKTEYTEKISFCLQIPTTKFEEFNKNILASPDREIVIVDKDN
jgi:uncharacterized YigZ family protein